MVLKGLDLPTKQAFRKTMYSFIECTEPLTKYALCLTTTRQRAPGSKVCEEVPPHSSDLQNKSLTSGYSLV